jgi:hypothetical protein
MFLPIEKLSIKVGIKKHLDISDELLSPESLPSHAFE